MSAIKRLGIKAEKNKTSEYTDKQAQTSSTFGYKWSRKETYESDSMKAFVKNWLIERYTDNNHTIINEWLKGGSKIILDAGCGSGLSASLLFGKVLNDNDYLGVDISESVFIAKEKFDEEGIKGEFLQASILDLPVADESVDMIFSEGVLHHTDSTERALKYLAKKIKSGGMFLFYVYAKKAVIREFVDDHVRMEMNKFSDEEAWEKLKPLTKLGIELGKIKEKIEVPEDIPFLGIKKGSYDLQRFFYWNIFKAYYREDFDLEEMNHVNFDWYRPLNCQRQTKEEIMRYCDEAGLDIERLNTQEAGFTIVARKI
ncbi:MAG: class I SAM-dependent methyltransferase [Ignavibacteria bacterium]